jgi:hypothetical protein
MHISSADMAVLSSYRVELQRINDMGLKVDPKVIEYIKGRINSIESPSPETEQSLLS